MGIEIKRKKMNGVEMYQLRSTISDELYHTEDWVTIDGAKKALMESKVWKFCEELVQVDMEFPNFYHVNGKPPKAYSDKTMQRFCEYALKNYYSKGGGKKLDTDFQAILKKFSIEIQEPPTIQFGLYKVEIDGNSIRDNYTLEAISDAEEKLETYCKETFNKEVGKPKVFSWDDYYVIQPYKMKVV
jgi:hypothetical protein